jgi:hypothetical protein
LILFAANFIRRATRWLDEQADQKLEVYALLASPCAT